MKNIFFSIVIVIIFFIDVGKVGVSKNILKA